jgi:dihydrofolate synthase/folylpolyglutamate synthase
MKTFRTIDEALDYLYSFINYESDSSFSYKARYYNVERTVKLLEFLGNPQLEKKIIHVAGTKGKGSICKIAASLLDASTRHVGLFTSPHVEKVNERIEVDGKQIEDLEIVALMNEIAPLIARFPRDNQPTTFEILTALAMRYFHAKDANHVVLETGMGGRFDSTNFADPAVSVISPVSLDHTDKLGNEVHLIAREKAGIIKPGKPVVIGYQRHDIEGVVRERARKLGSPFHSVRERCSYKILETGERGSRFDAGIEELTLKALFLSLPGAHQVENAVTSLFALKVIDLLPSEPVLKSALKTIQFPTRLELIERERRFLLDSAHNRDSAEALVSAVKALYNYERLFSIVGIVKGKDIEGILECVASVSDELFISEPVTNKELDTQLVFDTARRFFPACRLIEDLYGAVRHAAERSTPNDLILITGSFYTTSPVREYLLSR